MNRVYKLTPVSQYDVSGLESWLEDQARRGLTLKKFRPLFCTFAKGEPRPARYRVEPHRRPADEDPPQSMLELYGAFGWDYVGEIGRSMLIFSTRDPDARELHTDPELQAGLWKKLHRSVRRGFFLNLFLLALIPALILFLLYGAGTPVLALLTTSALPLSLWELYELALLPASWADLRRLSLIARQLKAGVPLNHRAPYPRHRRTALASILAAGVVLALLVAQQWVLPFLGSGILPLEELKTDFVPLTLQSLTGEPHPFRSSGGTDYANFCCQERYLLCWNQWQVVQGGGSGPSRQWVRLEIQWYDLPVGFISQALAREQLNKAIVGQPGDHVTDFADYLWWTVDDKCTWTVNTYPNLSADYLSVACTEDGRFQAAAAADGDKVAVVRYTGSGSLSDHLEEIAAMVTG